LTAARFDGRRLHFRGFCARAAVAAEVLPKIMANVTELQQNRDGRGICAVLASKRARFRRELILSAP